MKKESRIPIRGHIRISLHPSGIWYFRKQKLPIEEIKMFDNSTSQGFNVEKFDCSQIQRLASYGFIDQIELAIKDIAKERQQLIDLTKLFCYGMLYRQFDAFMWDTVLASPLTLKWNREFKSVPIQFGMNINDPNITVKIQKNQKSIQQFKRSLFGSIEDKIKKQKIDNDEKQTKLYTAIRYLNIVNPVFWLLLINAKDDPATKYLIDSLQNSLEQYIKRSDCPEYLSLVIIEMVLIMQGVNRGRKEGEGNKNNESVQLSIKFSPKKWERHERTTMYLFISASHQEFGRLSEQIKHNQQKQKNIKQFLTSSTENHEVANTEMSLYYLSCLQEACQRMKILFTSSVNISPYTLRSMINLMLKF